MKLTESIAGIIVGLVFCTQSLAQNTSCVAKVVDVKSLAACVAAEIEPLNTKVNALTQELSRRFKDNPDFLTYLGLSKNSWNAYYMNHCFFEPAVRASKAKMDPQSIEAQRYAVECSKRLLEQRVRELEALL